jgi:hypothetical protein
LHVGSTTPQQPLTDRSMPPTGGMMPRNTCRKGSVSCGQAQAQARATWGGEGAQGGRSRQQCQRCGAHRPRVHHAAPVLCVTGAPAHSRRPFARTHLPQRVPGLAEPVDVAEPAQQHAHGQDGQVHLRVGGSSGRSARLRAGWL